jgi:predicted nucleic acid-binding protein
VAPPYLVDTSAWNRSTHVADRWAKLLTRDEIYLCAPVRLELLYSARDVSDYVALASELDAVPFLPLHNRTAACASQTQRSLARDGHHRGPKPIDLLIAAIAEDHDVTLLHYDRHFDLIAGVTGQRTEWLARRWSLD